MVTGWFDFTLVCVVLRLTRTVDVFFIGRDWKKFSADIAASLFPVLPKPNRTNAVSDDVEKSLMRKVPENASGPVWCFFGMCVRRVAYRFLRTYQQKEPLLMPCTTGSVSARPERNFFEVKIALKKMK